MKGGYLKRWLKACSVFYALFSSNLCAAQVVGDTTLPIGERSLVTGNPNFQIDGGARRGGNLFHSFEQFSVPTGGSAYFNNAADIQNILTRVTGGSISNIDGLIRANGTANLFLLNPNGIIFGANAQLNVGGSFVATSADAIGLANGDIFSANPGQPLPSQLLNVNPNAFFFNQLAAQSIANNSTANGTGLQVAPGQSLLLVGGDIRFDGGLIQAPGSRVELGSVAGQGTIGLSGTNGELRLSFPAGVARADVSFDNYADVKVRGGGGGSIAVTARNVSMAGESSLRAGIDNGLGAVGAQAGDIDIDATGSVNLTDGFQVSNTVRPGATGNAGNVTINAQDSVSLDNLTNRQSAIFNQVAPGGMGNAGNIIINARVLWLTNGAPIAAVTYGQGNAGNVTINARDTVSLDGATPDGQVTSTIFTVVQTPEAVGKGGDITITTGSLFLTNGGALNTASNGTGNAGKVTIQAHDQVVMDGVASANNALRSGVFSSVASTGRGKGGDISITTGSLAVTNQARINADTLGQGDAGTINIQARDSVSFNGGFSFNSVGQGAVGNGGNINIIARSFTLTNGSKLLTFSRSQGDAGKITINAADSITIAGQGDPSIPILDFDQPILQGLSPASGLFTGTDTNSTGRGDDITVTTGKLSVADGAVLNAQTQNNFKGGDITVNANSLSVTSGGQLLTSTSSSGRAGDITVNASQLQLAGANTGLFAQTTSTGRAGNLRIQALDGQTLAVNLQQGAKVSAATTSSGAGGTLTVSAPGAITISGNGSLVTSGTSAGGNGGDLTLSTGKLAVSDKAQVTVSSTGSGWAGTLIVAATDAITLDNGAKISADTSGGGGNINLRSPLILLRNGSSISTNARGSNIPGGNIRIDTDNLVAVPKEDSDITANSEDFRGGNVTVRAIGIFGIEFREEPTSLSDITATGVSEEFSGTVELITPGIDPARGLAELPTDVVDASDAISRGCRDVQGSSFVVTGRGGLPPTPQQALGDDPRWRDWRTQSEISRQPNAPANGTLPPSANPPSTKSALVEATGWVFAADGQVILTASAPNVTSPHRWGQPVNCDGS